MSGKKKRKGDGRAGKGSASNNGSKMPEIPPGLALDARGERVFVTPSPWRASYGYWNTWNLTRQLAASAFQTQDHEQRTRQQLFHWSADVVANSIEEQTQLIGAQMRVAQLAVRSLAEAQVVIIDPERLHEIEQFENHEQAQMFTLQVSLPFDPLYLDYSGGGRARLAAMSVEPGGEPWAFAGALLCKEPYGISLVPFAAPAGEAEPGPAFQPLARLLLGHGDELPTPEPGEIAVDCVSGQSVTPLVHDPESRINIRHGGALALATGALSFLAHLLREDVELLPELRNPNARQQCALRGERIALTPRVKRTVDPR